MKRHLSFVSLSHEHHDGLLLATRLQQGTNALLRLWSHDLHWQAEYIVKYFDEHLDQHFSIEEQIIFPVANQFLVEHSGIVQKLIDQHNEMRSMVELFRHPIKTKLQNTLPQFGKLLEEHIRIEERELFPLCEEYLPEERLNIIGKTIKEFSKKQ